MFKLNRCVGAHADDVADAGALNDADASFLCVAGAGMQLIRVGL